MAKRKFNAAPTNGMVRTAKQQLETKQARNRAEYTTRLQRDVVIVKTKGDIVRTYIEQGISDPKEIITRTGELMKYIFKLEETDFPDIRPLP